MARSVSQLKEEARRAEKREDWSRAIDLYREALQLTEESGELSLDLSLYNRIGDLYRRGGDTDEAVRFYRKAVRQYADQGLHTGAVALCNKILRLAPDHVDVYRVLGRLHATSGLAAEARNAFETYAERMEERGDRAAAQDARLELARLVGDDEALVDVLGRMASTGRETEARAALAEVWREQRDRPEGLDPRVRELADEMDVTDASAAELDTDGAGDREADHVEPEDEGPDTTAGGSAGEDAGDGDPGDPEEREGASAGPRAESRDAAETEQRDGDQEGEEEDTEGVDLEEILLHDPSASGTGGGEQGEPGAPPDRGPDEADEEASAQGREGADGGVEETASTAEAPPPSAPPEGGKDRPVDAGPDDGESPPEAEDGGSVDLGERIRRRLDASPRRGSERDAPDPGDFDDILVGFRAEAAATSGEADPEAHVELGVALRQMGLLDDAIREFQVAARAADPPLRAFELLGESFLDKGLHGVAVRVLNRALRLPGYSDHELLGILYQLGVAYQSVDEHGEALDCFERVYSVDIDFRDVAERMETVRSAG